MKTTSFEIQSLDHFRLSGASFAPDTNPSAVIALVHGFGEHIGRYEWVAKTLTDSGFALVMIDLRGHGNSGGSRAFAPGIESMLDDISLLLKKAESDFPGKPLFLYGHSMGGLLVLNHVLRHHPKLNGVIASSPFLQAVAPGSPLKLALASLLYKISPAIRFHNGVKAKDLSRDPEIVRAVLSDPLYTFHISVKLGLDLIDAGKWASEHAPEFDLPLLLMHGTTDALTSFETTKKFASMVHSNCTLKLWNGFYHELHNEPEKSDVIQYAIDWMKSIINPSL